MKSDMWNATQCGSALSACAVVFYLSGCGALETVKTTCAAVSGKSATYPVEVPKASLGVLQDSYLVIDISGGQAATAWPVTKLEKMPEGGWGDEYKTDKIVLRKVNAGSFWRQRCTPEEAWNRKSSNPPQEQFVNKSFYIGVFEVTQRQYEHVTGMNPSHCSPTEGWETLPVETVAYDDIRGRRAGACYPNSRDVDEQSFMGILRQKTGLGNFDLPTEDIWEYCCSAGGSYLEMAQLGSNARFSRYPDAEIANAAPAKVGSYQPNKLGLYEMQGNVHEWCLDLVGNLAPKQIPVRRFGCDRIVKGGYYDSLPELCHPSLAFGQCSSFGTPAIGFRICAY